LASNLELDATLYPRRVSRHVMTFETGYRSDDDGFTLWGSATGEYPIFKPIPDTWMPGLMGPAVVASAGTEFRFKTGFKFAASYLLNREILPSVAPGAIAPVTPRRIPLDSALKLGTGWNGPSKISYDVMWTYDLPNRSSWLSFDSNLAATQNWSVGIGGDLFSSSTGTGIFGQYYGNDRIRGRFSYAF
jgi:hypothetical protein